jgi:hypothetical protein
MPTQAQSVLNRFCLASCVLRPASSLFDFCREPSTNRPFSCKTNPICTSPQYALTSFITKCYAKKAIFSRPKANPNEPKQSQSDPHFSPAKATQSQNEPKQTQSKPNLSRRSLLATPAARPLKDSGFLRIMAAELTVLMRLIL